MNNENQIKQENLQWFKNFARICKKHNIWYSVFAGTMIGAIREKGTIPWDDDYDVMMTPESYNKLRKIYPHYCLDYRSNKNYPYLWNKFLPNLEDLYSNAIFIDIFITIPTKKKNIIKFANKWNKFKYAVGIVYGVQWWKTKPIAMILFAIAIWPMQFFIKRINYVNYINKIRTEKNEADIYFIIDVPFSKSHSSYVNLMSFQTKLIQFEDFQVSIIIEYDELLTRMFNDYMTLKKFKNKHLNVVETKQIWENYQ